MPVNYRVIDNRKYMWDGKIYANDDEALNAACGYKKDNFDVQLVSAAGETSPDGGREDGKYLIYTRRVAATTAVQ